MTDKDQKEKGHGQTPDGAVNQNTPAGNKQTDPKTNVPLPDAGPDKDTLDK